MHERAVPRGLIPTAGRNLENGGIDVATPLAATPYVEGWCGSRSLLVGFVGRIIIFGFIGLVGVGDLYLVGCASV